MLYVLFIKFFVYCNSVIKVVVINLKKNILVYLCFTYDKIVIKNNYYLKNFNLDLKYY